jgi:adenylate cyclase class 2
MLKDSQEREVKFLIRDLSLVESKLNEFGATMIQSRVYERNLRFDTPEGSLSSQHKVLRLRQDNNVYITYKNGGIIQDGIQQRQEIEISVNDFDTAQRLLNALGYEVLMVYEKYRTIYELKTVLVTLDKMPFGDFVEVEGSSAENIRTTSLQLGLNWENRILESYTGIFNQVCAAHNLKFQDLTFDNFNQIHDSLSKLKFQPAD